MFVFFSVFVTSSCDVVHNDDGICKIASPMFGFLVDSPSFGISNHKHQVTSKRQRCMRKTSFRGRHVAPLGYNILIPIADL